MRFKMVADPSDRDDRPVTRLRPNASDRNMIGLDDPVWATLHHAGGNASRYPAVLRAIAALVNADGEPDDQLLEDMWDICHQLSTYDATLAAIPHLMALCASASPAQPIRKALLDLISCSVACARTDRTSSTPEIESGFRSSLSQLPELVQATMPYAKDRAELCRLLGAFAISAGDDPLGMLLIELPHGTLQCEKCDTDTSPFESSLNPLWNP